MRSTGSLANHLKHNPDSQGSVNSQNTSGNYMPKETHVEGNKEMSISLAELKEKNITDLAKIAKELNIPGASGMRKQALIFQLLRAQTQKNGVICCEVVLECLPAGFGVLRAPDCH